MRLPSRQAFKRWLRLYLLYLVVGVAAILITFFFTSELPNLGRWVELILSTCGETVIDASLGE